MTNLVKIGGVEIGAGRPVAIQSMAKTDTRDAEATAVQIRELQDVGCEIMRVAVPDMAAATAVGDIRRRIDIPLVADIHFDYRLALECIRQGADKIRINPGNIGDDARVRQVADAARERGVPIRIGVNGGSLDRDLLRKYGGVTSEALCESAVNQAEALNMHGFYDIVVSIKASDVKRTVEACLLFDEKNTGIPQHIGLTEAGTPTGGLVKSTIAIYELLRRGVGDTLRISLTGDPVDEVLAAKTLLRTFETMRADERGPDGKTGAGAGAEMTVFSAENAVKGMRLGGVEVISCPTCGRCKTDMIEIVKVVEKRVNFIKTDKHIKVAIMGCAVNGPGEAREADVGAACGDGAALIFKRGEPLYKAPQAELADALLREIYEML